MSKNYDSSAIEVLTGLEPVRKRPGMYTQTDRPNHLAQEVIDNSVDEAVAGHATRIDVVLYKDGSLSVTDDGPGPDSTVAVTVEGVGLGTTRERLATLYGERARLELVQDGPSGGGA